MLGDQKQPSSLRVKFTECTVILAGSGTFLVKAVDVVWNKLTENVVNNRLLNILRRIVT